MRKTQRIESQIEAVKKANTGKKLSRKHKLRIKESMQFKFALVIAMKDEKIMAFNTAADVAKYIGCTRQLISQCIKKPEVYKTARDWKITTLTKEQVKELFN